MLHQLKLLLSVIFGLCFESKPFFLLNLCVYVVSLKTPARVYIVENMCHSIYAVYLKKVKTHIVG